MLIATDLDGTFLAGSPDGLRTLHDWIRSEPGVRLAYVTGRGLPLVLPLLDDARLAPPDYIVCDVGATLTDARGQPLQALVADIEARWPGEPLVEATLRGVPGLRRQSQPQARRCSYHCEPDAVTPEVHEAVQALGCDLLYSAGWYLDVLPRGVNKGSSLRRLVRHLGLDARDVLVAGDTLNDLAMYEHGFRGVCVGGSEPGLLAATRGLPHVFHASGPGCDGILQALAHFDLRRPPWTPTP